MWTKLHHLLTSCIQYALLEMYTYSNSVTQMQLQKTLTLQTMCVLSVVKRWWRVARSFLVITSSTWHVSAHGFRGSRLVQHVGWTSSAKLFCHNSVRHKQGDSSSNNNNNNSRILRREKEQDPNRKVKVHENYTDGQLLLVHTVIYLPGWLRAVLTCADHNPNLIPLNNRPHLHAAEESCINWFSYMYKKGLVHISMS